MFALLLAACTKPIPPETLVVQPQSLAEELAEADLENGERLVRVNLGCTACHGPELQGDFVTDAFPMGTLVSPNLTLLDYEADDWVRAIRHGLGKEGQKLVLMPSDDYAKLTAGDLADVVAWLETLEPAGEDLGASALGPIGRKLVKDGDWPRTANHIDHDAPIPEDPASSTALERGRYLAEASACMSCHGGGPGKEFGPGDPPSANLTPHADGLAGWTVQDFAKAMREGVRPDGSSLDPFMPWPIYAGLDDEEIDALWTYLQSLEPMPDP